MNKRIITVIVILFVLSIVTCNRLLAFSTVRTVEFIAIFVCGALAGLLISVLVLRKRDNNIRE